MEILAGVVVSARWEAGGGFRYWSKKVSLRSISNLHGGQLVFERLRSFRLSLLSAQPEQGVSKSGL